MKSASFLQDKEQERYWEVSIHLSSGTDIGDCLILTGNTTRLWGKLPFLFWYEQGDCKGAAEKLLAYVGLTSVSFWQDTEQEYGGVSLQLWCKRGDCQGLQRSCLPMLTSVSFWQETQQDFGGGFPFIFWYGQRRLQGAAWKLGFY